MLCMLAARLLLIGRKRVGYRGWVKTLLRVENLQPITLRNVAKVY